MEPRELQELLRDLLLQASRPEIATVTVRADQASGEAGREAAVAADRRP